MKNKNNKFLEYSSIILIFSYFFIKNIIFIFLGIILSFYLININFFKSIMISDIKNTFKKNISKKLEIKNKLKKSDSNQIKSTKENSCISLVEEIEVLGYIPSTDNKKDFNAA